MNDVTFHRRKGSVPLNNYVKNVKSGDSSSSRWTKYKLISNGMTHARRPLYKSRSDPDTLMTQRYKNREGVHIIPKQRSLDDSGRCDNPIEKSVFDRWKNRSAYVSLASSNDSSSTRKQTKLDNQEMVDIKHVNYTKRKESLLTNAIKSTATSIIRDKHDGTVNTVKNGEPVLYKYRPRRESTDSKTDIFALIDEIESVPLDVVLNPRRKSVCDPNKTKTRASEKIGHQRVENSTSPSLNFKDKASRGIFSVSSVNSFISSDSRKSSLSQKSILSFSSHVSTCSQKSLAERICEYRTFLFGSQSQNDKDNKPLNLWSTNMPCSSIQDEHDDAISHASVKKHVPDIEPKEGENTFPIIKRKQIRRILES